MLQLARSSKYLLTKKFDLFIFMHTELYRMQSTCSQSDLFFYIFEKMRHESRFCVLRQQEKITPL